MHSQYVLTVTRTSQCSSRNTNQLQLSLALMITIFNVAGSPLLCEARTDSINNCFGVFSLGPLLLSFSLPCITIHQTLHFTKHGQWTQYFKYKSVNPVFSGRKVRENQEKEWCGRELSRSCLITFPRAAHLEKAHLSATKRQLFVVKRALSAGLPVPRLILTRWKWNHHLKWASVQEKTLCLNSK